MKPSIYSGFPMLPSGVIKHAWKSPNWMEGPFSSIFHVLNNTGGYHLSWHKRVTPRRAPQPFLTTTTYPLVICYSLLLKMIIEIVDLPIDSMVISQFITLVITRLGKSHKIPLNYHFPMVFLWFSYGFPMVFLWFSYGFPSFPMVFLCSITTTYHNCNCNCHGTGPMLPPGPPGPPSGRELILRAIGDEVHRLVEVLATNVHHQLTSKPKTGWWFGIPLWKIWLRQLGWWHSQYMEKCKSCSKPPTRRPSWPRNMINMACWARQSSDVVRLKKLTSKSRSSRSSESLYCIHFLSASGRVGGVGGVLLQSKKHQHEASAPVWTRFPMDAMVILLGGSSHLVSRLYPQL